MGEERDRQVMGFSTRTTELARIVCHWFLVRISF